MMVKEQIQDESLLTYDVVLCFHVGDGNTGPESWRVNGLGGGLLHSGSSKSNDR